MMLPRADLRRHPSSPVAEAARYTSRPGLRLLHRLMIVGLPLGSVWALHYFAAQSFGEKQRAWASVVCLGCWISFVVHVLSVNQGLPFVPVISFIYGLYYGAPVFLPEKHFAGVRQLSWNLAS